VADGKLASSRRALEVRVPWWLSVTAIFLASRVVSTALLLAFARRQEANAWTGANPSYVDFATMWDGTWYFIVAVSGYPTELPVTDDGHVAENAWAFLPAYPFLVRGIMALTGADFGIVAVAVSVAFAYGTSLMFYRLLRERLPHGTALFAVVLLCVSPVSPILQVAYAESMFAFFLTLALYLLVTRRYLAIIPVVFALDFTRPGGLAFALALGLHVIYRFAIRAREPFPHRERIESIVATVATVIFGLAWPVIAWASTGSVTAYTDTELSWRAPYIGYGDLIPLTPWFQGANWWVPQQPLGPILLCIAIALFVGFMFTPAVKRLGVDIRFFIGSFALYILAVFFPQSSTFRILFPMFPLLGAVAQPRSRVYRASIVVMSIALQWGWLYIAWWVDGSDWTPP
jgi:heme/copper-type cytochrome/quinol oxidase subunit 2